MRPVNLLPERYRPARATGRLRGSAYVTVAVLGVLLLMVVGYVVTQNQINDARDATNRAIEEAQVAEARANALGSFGNFQQIKEQRETAVKGLALTRFDYERLMREIALLLPEDVYLTSFASTPAAQNQEPQPGGITATGPTLEIGGCAPTHRDVSTTLVRLRRLHKVIEVNLTSSVKADEDDGEGGSGGGDTGGCRVAWNAVASFEAEAAPPSRPAVPARLGGGA